MYQLSQADGFKYPNREEIYLLDIIPLGVGLAVIASDQSLSIFDPLRLGQGPTKRLQTDHGNITCAKAYNAAESIVCTAGESGSSSLWDLRLNPSQARVLQLQGSQHSLLSLGCSSENNAIAAGTELANHQASVLIWDVRSPSNPRSHYDEIHSDDVTELRFHPSDPNILLSGSTDGLVNVNDIRITDEDEVVIQAFNHGSIHHAGFLTNTEVFALSHDEKFALYDMAETVENGSAVLDLGDIRQVLGCQYVANVLPKQNGAGAVIGVGSQDQELFQLIHLSKSDGWGLDNTSVVAIPGAHGSELVRSFFLYDEEQVLITAGEDSCIKAWRPS